MAPGSPRKPSMERETLLSGILPELAPKEGLSEKLCRAGVEFEQEGLTPQLFGKSNGK